VKCIPIALCLAALSQAQPVDRSRAPGSPEARLWKLPSVFETRLPNGITLVLVDDRRVPLVTMRLAFPCGNRRDPKALPGLASAVADMLMQGTATKTFAEIAEEIDALGATMTVASGADQIVLAGSVIADNLPGLLEIASDVARNSSFPELELRLFKQNRTQILARQRAQSGVIANEEFRRAIFGEHPYAHTGPTAAAIDHMDRNALIDYRDTYFVPNNSFLVLVGRLPARGQVLKSIEDRFGSWQRTTLPASVDDVPLPPAPKQRLIVVDRPGSVQADIHLGKIVATQRDPDYAAMTLASVIVGSVPMGRMFLDIREKLGLAYDVRAEQAAFDNAGIFAVVTQVRNDGVANALQAILDHLDRMAKELVTSRELADAKTSASSAFLLRLEPQAGLADALVTLHVQHLPPDSIETFTARIEAVTAEQVRQAAKKYLAAGNDAIVVVCDAAKVGPQLQKLGTFETIMAK